MGAVHLLQSEVGRAKVIEAKNIQIHAAFFWLQTILLVKQYFRFRG